MKCVIVQLCPTAIVIDLTHEVPLFDVLAGAYAVSQSAPFSPPGSIHVVVVDPGVGSARRAIAVRSRDRIFIGPDNGVLSFALGEGASVRQLTSDKIRAKNVSGTFHGRDIFAPAAAHLAAGTIRWESIGPEVKDPVRLSGLDPVEEYAGRWRGTVLSVDRFGNVITNLKPPPNPLVTGQFTVEVNARPVRRFEQTFAAVEDSHPFVYVGSSGYLEIGINRGNAASTLEIAAGNPVVLDLNA